MYMKSKRIPTGIGDLDLLIEGGLRKGKTYLVVGEPGTGKSIFGLQFLMQGLGQKEKGLYVVIDEKPTDVIEQAVSLGWDLAPYIESKEFLILDASAYFSNRADDGKSIDVQREYSRISIPISRVSAPRGWLSIRLVRYYSPMMRPRGLLTRRACCFMGCRPIPRPPMF